MISLTAMNWRSRNRTVAISRNDAEQVAATFGAVTAAFAARAGSYKPDSGRRKHAVRWWNKYVWDDESAAVAAVVVDTASFLASIAQRRNPAAGSSLRHAVVFANRQPLFLSPK